MTREEAISELKYAQAMCEFNPSTGEVGFRNDEDRKQHEAFGMAIEALQAEPVKRGKWIVDEKHTEEIYTNPVYCSVCGKDVVMDYGEYAPYCPNCGAKMDKK